MRKILSGLIFSLCVVCACPAMAQIPPGQVGTMMWFDHNDFADTEFYQLCIDGVSDAKCSNIGVLRVGTSDSFTFTLPSTVSRGNHTFQVRAVGYLQTGSSDGSNIVSLRIVGKPRIITFLRLQEAVTP